MADVTLITPAAITTSTQPVAAGGQQAQSATQSGTPNTTSHLPPGTIVAGVIAGKDAQGSYMLRTQQGTFTLRSTAPLTYNSDVVIRVDTSAGSQASAKIISVNGEAYVSYSTPAPPEQDSVSQHLLTRAGQPQANAPQANLPQTGHTGQAQAPAQEQAQPALPPSIKATTLPAPPAAAPVPGAPTPPPAAPVPPGVEVTVHVQPPPAAGGAQTPANPPQAQAPVQPAATPQAPAPAEPLPGNVAKLLVPQPITLKDSGSHLPDPLAPPRSAGQPQATQGQGAPQGPAANPYAAYQKNAAMQQPAQQEVRPALPTLLPATVTSATPQALVLATPIGTLHMQPQTLPTHAALPPNASVTVELPEQLVAQSPALSAALTQPSGLPDGLAASLKDIFTLLQAANPAMARELTQRLPDMGQNFLSSSVGFLSALLKGNGEDILGKNVADALRQQGAGRLVDAFSAEVRQAAQQFSQPQQQGGAQAPWQHVTLPFFAQEAIQQAQLYVRRDGSRKDKDGRKAAGDTRFIVEVSLSEIGAMQIDGLVRRQSAGTVFDLMLRSHTPLSAEDHVHIRNIYAEAAAIGGFKGSLGFAVEREFAVRPQAGLAEAVHQGITA